MESINIQPTVDTDNGVIRVSSDDSYEFLSSTDAPPGFEYKWPNEKN
jgi:hypothetical protein